MRRALTYASGPEGYFNGAIRPVIYFIFAIHLYPTI